MGAAGRGKLEWAKKSGKGPYKKYRLLLEAILQAIAQGRLTAEIKAHDESPLDWLKQGPGKETPDSPGWTTPVKPTVNQTNNTVNLLLHPEMQSLFAAILQVMAPYPEARQAVSEALAGGQEATPIAAPGVAFFLDATGGQAHLGPLELPARAANKPSPANPASCPGPATSTGHLLAPPAETGKIVVRGATPRWFDFRRTVHVEGLKDTRTFLRNVLPGLAIVLEFLAFAALSGLLDKESATAAWNSLLGKDSSAAILGAVTLFFASGAAGYIVANIYHAILNYLPFWSFDYHSVLRSLSDAGHLRVFRLDGTPITFDRRWRNQGRRITASPGYRRLAGFLRENSCPGRRRSASGQCCPWMGVPSAVRG